MQPFGATNEPDTCLWCGRKLKHNVLRELNPAYEPANKARTASGDLSVETLRALPPMLLKRGHAKLGGSRQDGFFCGLMCGYRFGQRQAQLGSRLRAQKRAERF